MLGARRPPADVLNGTAYALSASGTAFALVKHEEMHALLQSALHPPAYFDGPCGDLTYPNEG
jgi:hypothetical protein